jgi:hypothetical protein
MEDAKKILDLRLNMWENVNPIQFSYQKGYMRHRHCEIKEPFL